MEAAATKDKFAFLQGGGEMGALVRTYDWSKTVLGAPGSWPQSLRTVVGIILSSKFPMFLWWGPELIQFYNDAYRPSLGNEGKHPAVGAKGEDTWPEIWPVIKPLIDQVLGGGEASWSEDQLIPIYRNGRLEDVYWTFSYSPVRDDHGEPAGVLVTCAETTDRVLNMRRLTVTNAQLAERNDELAFAINAADLGIWDLNPAIGRFTANARLKNWFGLKPHEEIPLALAVEVIAEADRQRVSDAIATALQYESGGGYEITYTILPPGVGTARLVKAKGRAWFGPDKIAYCFNGTLQDITAEYKARQERSNARALTNLAVKNSGLGIFTITIADGHMEYTPELAAILTGDPQREGLTRQDFAGLIHPGDEPMRAVAEKEVLATGRFDYEPRILREDGSVRYLRLMGVLVKDDSGNPTLFSGTVLDVTEQHSARQKLEESEQFSRSIFYNSPVAKLVYTGPDMVLREANEKMLEIFGRGNSIIGQPVMEAIPELQNTPLLKQYRWVMATGEIHHEYAARIELMRGGQPYTGYYDYTYKPLRDAEGIIYGVICTAMEVTAQVEDRRRLEEGGQALRSAIDLAELGTWETNIVTGLTRLSPRHAEMFGMDELEMPAGTALACVVEEDRGRVAAAFFGAQQQGSNGRYEAEYRIVNARTGQQQLIHATGQTYFDAEGKPQRIAGTARDITLQRAMQLALEAEVQERTEELAASNEELQATVEELANSNEALTHSNEELAQYAYVASHDLQEPLRKIRVFTDMLAAQSAMPEASRPLIDKVSQAAERMSMLIKDLLDFSRLLRSDTLMRPVNLNDVVAAVAGDFELIIQEKGAVIEAKDLPVIEAVSLQMNQLFYNLLSNSLKFTAPGTEPRITITGKLINNEEASRYITKPFVFSAYYHITFTDNGIGFETEYAEQIFEVFKRLHGRDLYPGSGIGLALCRRIAANHHGYLYAVSQPGRGSRFHIILPGRQHDFTSVIPDDFTFHPPPN